MSGALDHVLSPSNWELEQQYEDGHPINRTDPFYCGDYLVPEARQELAQLRAELKDAIEALKEMKQVTKVLGKGIGHIAVDADFFALWNNAEIHASKLIAKNKE